MNAEEINMTEIEKRATEWEYIATVDGREQPLLTRCHGDSDIHLFPDGGKIVQTESGEKYQAILLPYTLGYDDAVALRDALTKAIEEIDNDIK
jgi:hypothetical protein